MQLTVKDLYLELEALKKRVEVLESLIIEEEASELELLSFDDALKELGIDEAEIRKELHKGVFFKKSMPAPPKSGFSRI